MKKWYVKTERFNSYALSLTSREKQKYITQHKCWVYKLRDSGIRVYSGYLIDKDLLPGGGGLMTLQVNSYEEARKIIEKDPMIKNKLVDWKLHQWVSI